MKTPARVVFTIILSSTLVAPHSLFAVESTSSSMEKDTAMPVIVYSPAPQASPSPTGTHSVSQIPSGSISEPGPITSSDFYIKMMTAQNQAKRNIEARQKSLLLRTPTPRYSPRPNEIPALIFTTQNPSPQPSATPSIFIMPTQPKPTPPSPTPSILRPNTSYRADRIQINNAAIRAALIAAAQKKAAAMKESARVKHEAALKTIDSKFKKELQRLDDTYRPAIQELEAKRDADIKKATEEFDIEGLEKETEEKLAALEEKKDQDLQAIEDELKASELQMTEGIIKAYEGRDELIERFKGYGEEDRKKARAEYEAHVDSIKQDSSLTQSEKDALILAAEKELDRKLADIDETVRIYTEDFTKDCEETIRRLTQAHLELAEDAKKRTDEINKNYETESQALKDHLEAQKEALKEKIADIKYQSDKVLNPIRKEYTQKIKDLADQNKADITKENDAYNTEIARIDQWLADEIARINAMYP